MNLSFETSFRVMPKHCNWQEDGTMIFGGSFMSELDLCAAAAVSRLLHDSVCDQAVTHKATFEFHRAAKVGDLVFMKATIVELRHRGIGINVRADREKQGQPGREHLADAHFVFVSKKENVFFHHGLVMP